MGLARPSRTTLVAGPAILIGEVLWLILALPSVALVSDITGILFATWAAVSCRAAAGRHPRVVRRLWTLMAITMALAATGRAIWTVGRLTGGTLPHTPLIGVVFVVGMIAGTAALLSCRPASITAVGRARAVLDGVIVGLSLVPIVWIAVLHDVTTAPLTDPARALGLVFPMLDLVQLAILVAVMGTARPMWRPLGLIGLSIGIRAVADTVYVSQVALGSYYPGHPIDALWPLSYLLVAIATGYPPTAATERVDELPYPAPWRVVLPYLPVGGAVIATAVAYDPSAPTPPLILITGMGLLAVLAIRQSLAASENIRLAARLRRLAYTDQLTGLPNRLLFARRLRAAISSRDRVAVLLLDLDGFKQVNDRFGHATGDALLTSIATRMREAVGTETMIARVGGDEFAILVDHDRAGPPEELAQRLLASLRPSADEEEAGVHSSASIGIATYGPQHTGHGDLLRDADIAMYAAKAAGKSAYRTCTPALREAAVSRAEMIADLRRALENGDQLELAFQPIVDLRTGAIRSAEALLRWRHPRRGLLTPDRFLALAEETGLILAMDRWVLHEACRAAAAWQELAPRTAVAVNIASMHLHRADITDTVTAATAAAGLPPPALTLELTETALIEGTDAVLDRLHQLREIGVRIAIDDFGTGYSSLSYLHRIPATDLKIDRSFVTRLGESDQAYATIEMITKLAAAYALVVVAEGVETDPQHRAVRTVGCPRGQGYFYGRPRTLSELRDSLRSG